MAFTISLAGIAVSACLSGSWPVAAAFVGSALLLGLGSIYECGTAVANVVSASSIFSWREAEFAAQFDPGATGTFAQRSPIERAIVAFVLPHVLPLEKELLQKNQFKVEFRPFDWRLNDLTGRSE